MKVPQEIIDFLQSMEIPSDEQELSDILHNPVYVGIPPYPAIVEEAVWIKAAKRLIGEEGVEQYLTKMLHILRESMASVD